jgi:hypothetical protein
MAAPRHFSGDNSPAFQRWEIGMQRNRVPLRGTKEYFGMNFWRPDPGLGRLFIIEKPSIKMVGYFLCS